MYYTYNPMFISIVLPKSRSIHLHWKCVTYNLHVN